MSARQVDISCILSLTHLRSLEIVFDNREIAALHSQSHDKLLIFIILTFGFFFCCCSVYIVERNFMVCNWSTIIIQAMIVKLNGIQIINNCFNGIADETLKVIRAVNLTLSIYQHFRCLLLIYIH